MNCDGEKLFFGGKNWFLTVRQYLCRITKTTSLGVNKRISLREVPIPFVIITGIPAELYFSPLKSEIHILRNELEYIVRKS